MSFPRYPEYRPSGAEWLCDVPSHWPSKRLKYACEFFSGGTPSKENRAYWDGAIPWASSKDLKVETLVDTIDHITELAVEDGATLVRPGDLLVVVRGMILAHSFPVAKVAAPMAINQDLKALRVRPEWMPDYFASLLRAAAPETFRRLDEAGHGTKALRMEAWTGMVMPVPPVEEQRAIAAFLDRETARIDALVAQQERLIELLREKRQAVISRAVTKGLDPTVPMKDSGVEWLGEVPAHWEVRRLKNIAARLQGRLIVQPQLYFADEGVPIVFGYNIKDGVIDEAGLSRIDHETDRRHAHAKARAGDLFTVRLGDPGKTVVVPKSLDGCHFASIMWIHQDERFDSAWLSHCMNSAVVQRQIEAVNYGAAQTQFNIRDAVDFRLPVPPLAEQREIAAAIDRQLATIDAATAEARRVVDLLRERRSALISAAVTGQIDVRGVPGSSAS